MHEAPGSRPHGPQSPSAKPRLGRRLLASCLAAAALPSVLVLLSVGGIGAERAYWTATGIAFALLAAWPFAARRRAGLERSSLLLVGLLAALLLSFFAGSILSTIAVSIWKPDTRVEVPGKAPDALAE